jgi:hypothetical protein
MTFVRLTDLFMSLPMMEVPRDYLSRNFPVRFLCVCVLLWFFCDLLRLQHSPCYDDNDDDDDDDDDDDGDDDSTFCSPLIQHF